MLMESHSGPCYQCTYLPAVEGQLLTHRGPSGALTLAKGSRPASRPPSPGQDLRQGSTYPFASTGTNSAKQFIFQFSVDGNEPRMQWRPHFCLWPVLTPSCFPSAPPDSMPSINCTRTPVSGSAPMECDPGQLLAQSKKFYYYQNMSTVATIFSPRAILKPAHPYLRSDKLGLRMWVKGHHIGI